MNHNLLHRRYTRLILTILILLGVSFACITPGNEGEEEGSPASAEGLVGTSVAETLTAQPPEDPPPPSDTPSVETPPTNTPAPSPESPACDPPDIIYQGVSFCYDPALASSITTEMVPALDSDGPGGSNPEHVQFNLMGYLLAGTFHEAHIMVFPADGYTAVNPFAGDMITDLQTLLGSQPSDPESIPFLPLWNAAQFMRAQVAYFDFQNGAGVRFLSLYGQAARVVNNEELFYTYQGLTGDGRFYISAVLPISHPSLPATSPADLDPDFYDNFETHTAESETQLNGQAEDSFAPSILILDEMMQSFTITAP
ncbi:MAG: hypothetical protein MAG431_00699 [Chloroflexi bacterium]|nr:hypothetical protein [Chloroflexota bacterium]